MRAVPTSALLAALAAVALAAPGCRSVYYDVMEAVGQEKRDILVRHVRASQREQEAAQEQILTTFQAFKEVTGYSGGELEQFYDRVRRDYERSEERAEAVRRRIRNIERVAADLFAEWEAEIGEISSPSLRRQSEQTLRETRARYAELIAALHRAEARMDPVLTAFRDQVLFLKHNLNARAIASLERNAAEIEDEVAALIADMQRAIRESQAFVASFEG